VPRFLDDLQTLCARSLLVQADPDEGQEATLNRPPTPGTKRLILSISAFPSSRRVKMSTRTIIGAEEDE
jgi:hypothetical protein